MSDISLKKIIKHAVTKQSQITDAFVLNAILALSGGFQDAYTYVMRGGVFANAQTGNVVLMSVNFLEGNVAKGFAYLMPILSFVCGVFVADNIQYFFKNAKKLHWRQMVLLIEILSLFVVAFIPQEFNMIANMLVSFSCAIQVQSFRKVAGNAYASTMCIGNLRSGTSYFASFVRSRDHVQLQKSLYYWGIILIFAIGAAIGGVWSKIFGIKIILVTCIILTVAFFVMELDREGH
ncbi:MAG: DUF1275 domain-containing protein [Butyrivibrio sp.]|nr:DUF1275 domain-containing protein [Butyrivibrio sp.]